MQTMQKRFMGLDPPLRYLREVAKEARGDHPTVEWKVYLRQQALNWRDGVTGRAEKS
jgi:hypothetical protein